MKHLFLRRGIRRIEGRATHVGKPPPFGEIKLGSLQVLRASAELFFGPLAVFDNETRSTPPNNLAAPVPHCYLMMEHPAIFALCAQDASFTQEGFATG